MAEILPARRGFDSAELPTQAAPLFQVLRYLPKATDDSWSGISDPIERRKRQNRLNVRAHRQRKQTQTAQSYIEPRIRVLDNPARPADWTDQVFADVSAGAPWLLAPCQPVRRWNFIDIRLLLNPFPEGQKLRMLVMYNVARAIATNMTILQIPQVVVQDGRDGDCALMRGDIELFPLPATTPKSLMATELQQTTPHAQWIDLLPHPRLRDNLISLADRYDECELLTDCAGDVHGDGRPCVSENAGMLIWAEPWHARGWELTEAFVKKWAFLLEGCEEMIEASNTWRAFRHERPIVVDL